MTRRGTASLVASPVLVGAVTVLIAIIAVFIAYNANSGLPFVPTYDLSAELPSGGKLVAGNEVRAGGFRVGVIDKIEPRSRPGGHAIALVRMKLDKTIEPLARDTQLTVRQRSALGLKYVELRPGRSRRHLAAGDVIPVRQTSQQLEFEDVYSTFDPKTRRNAQAATAGFGDAFAGRGQSINEAVGALAPLFRHLTPVMRSLADPDTRLDRLFPALARFTGEVAPVAGVQAQLFSDMADTFAAIGRDPEALRATIERSPPTLEVAIRSFRVQRPFLADLTDLSRRLRPAARELSRSLPPITSALRVGTPVLRRSVALNERLRDVGAALQSLFNRPTTLLAIKDLRTTLAVGRPALEYLTPFQLVCNYPLHFINNLGRHFGVPLGPATAERVLGKVIGNPLQPSHFGTTESAHPADIPADEDPQKAMNAFGHLHVMHGQPYPPAIDAQGNADCQTGQTGYLWKLVTDPGPSGPDGLGANHPVVEENTPGLAGPSWDAIRLGIHNLKDVP